MPKILRLFFKAEGTHPALVLLALLLAAVCEAIGISAVLPAISIVSTDLAIPANRAVGRGVEHALATIGLPPTFESILGLICIALILKAVISFLTLTYAGMSAAKVSVRLRQRLIDALFHANWRFYSSQESGKFATAISGEANRRGGLSAFGSIFRDGDSNRNLRRGHGDDRLAACLVRCGGQRAHGALAQYLRQHVAQGGAQAVRRHKDMTVKTVELLANIKPLKTMQRYASFQTVDRAGHAQAAAFAGPAGDFQADSTRAAT